jgi:hypothetical protein
MRFRNFFLLFSLASCSSQLINYLHLRERRNIRSLSSGLIDLAKHILYLFEKRKVAELGPYLNSSNCPNSAMKTLVNVKFETAQGMISFTDLLNAEKHLYFVLAKHLDFPLLDKIIRAIGDIVSKSPTLMHMALYEFITRIKNIYKHLPQSTDKPVVDKTIQLFDLLVDFVIGYPVNVKRLRILPLNNIPFLSALVAIEPLSFSLLNIDSYLLLLAYPQNEIQDCITILNRSPYFELLCPKNEKIAPIVDRNGGLFSAFISEPDDPLIQRMLRLINHYAQATPEILYPLRVRKARFFSHAHLLRYLPDPAIRVLFKYYLCLAEAVTVHDLYAIIDLDENQRLSLKLWQNRILGYDDSLSDPQIIEFSIIFESLLKLGIDRCNKIFFNLTKVIFPYFIKPDSFIDLPRALKVLPYLPAQEIKLEFFNSKLPFNTLVRFELIISEAFLYRKTPFLRAFKDGFEKNSFSYFFGRFLNFHLSFGIDFDIHLISFPTFKDAQTFFKNLYKAKNGMPHEPDFILKWLNRNAQAFYLENRENLSLDQWIILIDCVKESLLQSTVAQYI